MLTLDEQERRAYISGDTERAALLARVEDLEAGVADRVAELEDRIANCEQDTEEARDEAEEAHGDAEELRRQIRKLGGVPCAA